MEGQSWGGSIKGEGSTKRGTCINKEVGKNSTMYQQRD